MGTFRYRLEPLLEYFRFEQRRAEESAARARRVLSSHQAAVKAWRAHLRSQPRDEQLAMMAEHRAATARGRAVEAALRLSERRRKASALERHHAASMTRFWLLEERRGEAELDAQNVIPRQFCGRTPGGHKD